MVSSMAVSAAYAHAPTAVTLTPTETTVAITWTHTGAAGCATSEALSTCQDDVDIMRLPGQLASTNYTTLISNSTAYMVANNATGLSSWTDHSLPEGTVFQYTICHTEEESAGANPASLGCAPANVDGTNAKSATPVFTTTKASAINATNINFSTDQKHAQGQNNSRLCKYHCLVSFGLL